MEDKKRLEELRCLLADVEESERAVLDRLLSEMVFLEEEMRILRTKPFLVVHPRNPALVRSTPAAKLYKDCSHIYGNYIRILLTTIRKTDTSARDELLKKLEEFT